MKLFKEELKVINIGSPSFIKDYEIQEVDHLHLAWRPPANGDKELIAALEVIERNRDKISEANDTMINKVKKAQGKLIAVKKAIDVIPGMDQYTILHAGPPIKWENMAGPMQGAIIGALMYEGLATNADDAKRLASSGKIKFSPNHEHKAVGPMAGIISPSMPVHVLYDDVHDNYAYCNINEGLGKVLRFGANDEEVIKRLRWIRDVFANVLDEALQIASGIDVKNIIAQALHMGDECHNRNKAATSLFFREIVEPIMKTNFEINDKLAVINFVKNNEHYFLNLSMPYCKLALDAGRNIKYSSICTVMCRNGFEFGIQISHSNKWYTATANYVKGLFFPGFSEKDAARDLGDSAITETMGIGGFAMGGAPAIVQFVGGQVNDAFNYSLQMSEITHSTNSGFTLPTLDFRPTAIGIDIIKVVETGILPIINTGMAHKDAGVGQIGAGLVNPPFECFKNALLDYVANLNGDGEK